MKKIFITLAIMMLLSASNLFAQEITPGKEIDLGLPSGTIWAGWNVGATSPEEYGDYYAWGETEEKTNYNFGTYKYWVDGNKNGEWDSGESSYIGDNIAGTQYDVARHKWGGNWSLPTKREFEELCIFCQKSFYYYNGVSGYKFTGPNGNSIFLPFAGEDQKFNIERCGYYRSSTILDGSNNNSVWTLLINMKCCNNEFVDHRYRGYSVRPVKKQM